MGIAFISFQQITTMLIIMLIGVVCYKIKLVDDAVNKKLSSLLLLFINPLVFFLSYQREFEIELLQGLLISLGLAVLSFSIMLLIAHLIYRKKGQNSFALEKFAAIYSNSGFFGIPLINGIFGAEGVFYLSAYLTILIMLMFTHGIITISSEKSLNSLKKALYSPAIISVLLGFLMFVARIELPSIIVIPLQDLAALNMPLAMIISGSALCSISLKSMVKKRGIYKLCLIRLLIMPGIIAIVFSFLNVPIMLSSIIIIASACPVAANIILLSYKYEKDYAYASELVASTTVLSMFSIPVLLLILQL